MLSKFLMGARYDIETFIEGYEWVGEMWFILNKVTPILMIAIATIAAILLIVLGVKAAKQETPDKREKMVVLVKRILVGVLIGEAFLGLIYGFHFFLPMIVKNATKNLTDVAILLNL